MVMSLDAVRGQGVEESCRERSTKTQRQKSWLLFVLAVVDHADQ
jgi:hypothetical protein